MLTGPPPQRPVQLPQMATLSSTKSFGGLRPICEDEKRVVRHDQRSSAFVTLLCVMHGLGVLGSALEYLTLMKWS